jgi:hypothetical protein
MQVNMIIFLYKDFVVGNNLLVIYVQMMYHTPLFRNILTLLIYQVKLIILLDEISIILHSKSIFLLFITKLTYFLFSLLTILIIV